jgi:hypothetical protein
MKNREDLNGKALLIDHTTTADYRYVRCAGYVGNEDQCQGVIWHERMSNGTIASMCTHHCSVYDARLLLPDPDYTNRIANLLWVRSSFTAAPPPPHALLEDIIKSSIQFVRDTECRLAQHELFEMDATNAEGFVWCTNTNPSAPQRRMLYGTQDQADQNYKLFLSDKIIGRPKATDVHTVEQLEAMGYVGVYRKITKRINE